ncbi:MAG: DNA ligase-associated DEXH box helicase, partial [Chloroflexi bacterium]|nr:DNA ligase-associated DEXH box helicase [Chloroflexota bacterium]
YRLARLQPVTFTLVANDYGFELLAPDPTPLPDDLFSPAHLAADIQAALNESQMARRQFREVARVAGLIQERYPGGRKTARQLQASSGLLFDVLNEYDQGNMLLEQARREVLERQLEGSRLRAALHAVGSGSRLVTQPARLTPFAFPLWVSRLRETISSERLADRVARMTVRLEKAASR